MRGARALLTALCALHDKRPDAAALLHQAALACDGIDMPLYGAAARRRRGQLVGGDQGRAQIAAADTLLRARGVHAPERFASLLAPPVDWVAG